MLPNVDDRQFRIGVLVLAGLLAVGLVRLRFCYSVTLPAKITAPEVDDVSLGQIADAVQSNPSVYTGYLQKDAELYGVSQTPTLEQMSVAFRYQVDDSKHTLDPEGDGTLVEAAGLRLSLAVQQVPNTASLMMLLVIENTTNKDLAYQVVTRPSVGTQPCGRKATRAHNAMAIQAGARQERSECLYQRGWTLEIERIETMELPRLSFFYVSRVPPEVVGLDARVSRGHEPASGRLCSVMLPATIRNAREKGTLTWRDFVDFFARHRCDTYRFPDGYKAFTKDAERSLPAGTTL